MIQPRPDKDLAIMIKTDIRVKLYNNNVYLLPEPSTVQSSLDGVYGGKRKVTGIFFWLKNRLMILCSTYYEWLYICFLVENVM